MILVLNLPFCFLVLSLFFSYLFRLTTCHLIYESFVSPFRESFSFDFGQILRSFRLYCFKTASVLTVLYYPRMMSLQEQLMMACQICSFGSHWLVYTWLEFVWSFGYLLSFFLSSTLSLFETARKYEIYEECSSGDAWVGVKDISRLVFFLFCIN